MVANIQNIINVASIFIIIFRNYEIKIIKYRNCYSFLIYLQKKNNMKLRIKEIAKEKGILLSEIAEKAEMSTSTISNIIAGNNSPSLDTLERIARVLRVPTTSLIADSITGYIIIDDEVHVITCAEDLKEVYEKVNK